jgi:hypothetical protein
MSNIALPFIVTANSLTVYVDGKAFAYNASNELYTLIINALKARDWDKVRNLVNVKAELVSQSGGNVTVQSGTVFYKGEPIHNAVTNRILTMLQEGFSVEPMLLFLENLMNNPSMRAVNESYRFFEHCGLPITEDGCFLAYKMVRSDYKDIYSGKMDNSVGVTLSVPRNSVDDIATNTCSNGLHFASLEYVVNGNYGRREQGHRLMVVKINPANVVSIPVDYNNSKGRACEYTIHQEIEWDQRIRDNFTSSSNFIDAVEYDDNGNVKDSDQEDFDWDDWDSEYEEEEEDGDEDPELEQEDESPVKGGVLTDDEVRNILQHLEDGESLSSIARDYGVSARTIGRIRDGETYTHVELD